MNVLNLVNLPESRLESLRQQYPQLIIRTELDRNMLEEYREWAEIVFGNCPVDWASRASQLQWLQVVSTGIDAYLPLQGKPVKVTSAKGVHSQPIAQHLAMTMLAFSRNLLTHQQEQRRQLWNRNPDAITSLSGQRLGIVGFGGIGENMLPFARWVGMEVIGIKKNPDQQFPGVQIWGMERLEELLRTADHLVLALPFTPETDGLLNANRISQLKPRAFLYNVSRGELVDEKALVKALQSGQLGGAALDVFEKEPLPKEHPFWEMPHVIITPHIAGHFNGLRENTFDLFCENLSLFLQGKPLRNVVDFSKGY